MIKKHRILKPSTLALAAGIALTCISSPAIGDQVVLRDGTVYEGTVISESRREVIIETEVHGISTRMTLNARDVRSVTRTPLTATPSSTINTPNNTLSIPNNDAEDDADKPILKREGYQLLMEVPLTGTFGEAIYPLSVANSLEWAVENGVTDVVFRINSGGGALWCANDMVAIMKDYRSKVNMHMLIESAISASIWPSFNCHTITMAPGSDFGGAVGYTMNDTGSAEVDLKMNSIMSAKLESTADANGYSGYLVRAMILSKAAVYAYKEHGEWKFSNSTDGLPRNYEVIDGPDTVLTLTAKQAIKYGIVDAMEEGNTLEEWAQVQGIEKWDSVGDIGHEIAERDNKKCKSLQKRLDATLTSFRSDMLDYNADNRISQRGAAMQSMKRHLGMYKRIMMQAENMSMPSIVDGYEDAIDVVYWEQEIETNLARLRRYKRMGP